METIHYKELIGKHIEYRDNDGKTRIKKVAKRRGRTLFVKLPKHKRFTPIEKENVFCNIHHGHCRRAINWAIHWKK